MSQQINLYNPLFRKTGFSFASATALLYYVVAALALSGLAAVYENYQLRNASAVARATEEMHKAALARLEKLSATIAQQKPNAQLEAEVQRLESQLKGRQEVIEALNGGVVGNTVGFSDHMRAFSRQTIDGLWLTGFDIAQGGNDISIQGRTLNADLVSNYLDQLNREKPLQGHQFAMLRIGQPPANVSAQRPGEAPAPATARYLEFLLATNEALPAGGKGGAGAAETGLPPLLPRNNAEAPR
jgi:Tfp pilus assembly protein PilN